MLASARVKQAHRGPGVPPSSLAGLRLDVGSVTQVLRSAPTRPVRFVVTGGLAALVQLGLLQVWTGLGWDPLPANVVACLVAAQVNFWLSQLFTWGDRGGTRRIALSVAPRWARFHAAISGTALLNMAVFALARTLLPSLLAATLGIAVAAILNFVLADRLVFRPAAKHTA